MRGDVLGLWIPDSTLVITTARPRTASWQREPSCQWGRPAGGRSLRPDGLAAHAAAASGHAPATATGLCSLLATRRCRSRGSGSTRHTPRHFPEASHECASILALRMSSCRCRRIWRSQFDCCAEMGKAMVWRRLCGRWRWGSSPSIRGT